MNDSSNQERASSLDQAEPEPPQFKEEPEELCINQEEESLWLNQDADVNAELKSKCEENFRDCKRIMFQFKELSHYQYCLGIRNAETDLHKTEQQHLCEDKNKWHLHKRKRHSSLDQTEPEPLQIKEEPEELCSNQEGEQLLLNQETDVKMEFKSDLLDHQHHQRNITMIPVIKLERIAPDVQHQHLCDDKNKWHLHKRERHSSLDQAEPEPLQIKEEPEELCSNQEGEQLLLNQETDVKMEFKSDLLDHQHQQWNITMIPVIKLERIDVQQQHLCEDENKWHLHKRERHSSLDQAEPEPLQIKEEPEELCSNQEGEQLFLNQETDVKMEFKSDLLDHQHHQRNITMIPVIKLERIDVQQQHLCEDENKWHLHKRERHSSLDQAEPDPLQIKEEPEELCSNQEGEQLLLNQETDVKMEFKSDLLEHQHHQRNITMIPVIKLERIDLSEKNICKEETDDEQLLWKQERSSSLDEDKPELPLIKEEEEEVCIGDVCEPAQKAFPSHQGGIPESRF
ncbi:uncharacterized protein LOC105358153 isoform X11 [Oryzias latipes]